MFLTTSFYNNQQIIDNCRLNESEFFHSYLIAYRYHFIDVIPYHIIEFPIYAWISILMTYSWNFMDLFIILISIGLTTRFNQINMRLIKSFENNNDFYWTAIRMNYYAMLDLVDKVDTEISILVVVSTGRNLYSICVNIFESLTR